MRNLVALAGVALAVAAPAQAATISYNLAIQKELGRQANPRYFHQRLLPQFDPTLGTLEKIELASTVTYAVDLSWNLTGPARPLLASYGDFSALVIGTNPEDGTPTLLLGTHVPDRYLTAGYVRAGSDSIRLSETFTGRAVELDPYANAPGAIGTGTFAFLTEGEFWHYFEVISGDVQGTMSQSGMLTIDATWTFHYATAVPEPASWALMITGFAAAGGAARRRRSRQLGA